MFIGNSRFQRLYRIGNSHYQVGCHLPGLQCSAFVYVVDQKTHQFDCFRKILVRLQIVDLAALGCAEADLPGLQQCFSWLDCRPKKWPIWLFWKGFWSFYKFWIWQHVSAKQRHFARQEFFFSLYQHFELSKVYHWMLTMKTHPATNKFPANV